MDKLKVYGAEINYYDPYITKVKLRREHSQWAGVNSIKWSKGLISSYDVVLMCTAHNNINYDELRDWSTIIVDARNAMMDLNTKQGQLWKG